jgi:hypothetical protein
MDGAHTTVEPIALEILGVELRQTMVLGARPEVGGKPGELVRRCAAQRSTHHAFVRIQDLEHHEQFLRAISVLSADERVGPNATLLGLQVLPGALAAERSWGRVTQSRCFGAPFAKDEDQ